MLDAKELADLLFDNAIHKNDPELREKSDKLFLQAMMQPKILSKIWIDAICDISKKQENKLFDDLNKTISEVEDFKLVTGAGWAMTLSNSITLNQARIGCLVIKLINQFCENHVKENGEDLLTDALAYVHDMENEHDYA